MTERAESANLRLLDWS